MMAALNQLRRGMQAISIGVKMMSERNKVGDTARPIIWLLAFFLLVVGGAGCKKQEKIFTVGIVNSPPQLETCVKGFKEGMAELGYVEEKNIRYVFNGSVETNQEVIDAEIRRLLSHDIDLLFTTGNETTLSAKNLLKGKDIPIIFGAVTMVKEQGIVSDLSHPGGNITGVQTTSSIPKAMEWLSIIIPRIKKAFLPYNPDDIISRVTLLQLAGYKPQGDIELILKETRSVEEILASLKKMPATDAIIRIPSPTFDDRSAEVTRAAVEMGIPVVSIYPLDESVLITFGSEPFDMGKQASRMVHQIRLGIRPSDLPVESGIVYFTVNLMTAEKLGINIPDDILVQAKKIIR